MSNVELRRSGMDREMQRLVMALPAEEQQRIIAAYQENPDRRGCSRSEVTCPPMRGSNKYPYGRS